MKSGKHIARAIGTTLGFSKNETPGIEITFRSREGETGSTTLWLSEKAQERTRDTLVDVLGFSGTDISIFLDASEADCKHLLPNEVELVVEDEEFVNNGEKRTSSKIKWINKIGASSVTKVDGRDVRGFSDRFKGLFASKSPTNQPKPDKFPF